MCVHDEIAIGGILGQADHLAHEVADALLEAETNLVEAGGHIAQDVAAGHVDVAGDGHEVENALASLHAVGLLVDGKSPGNAGGLGLGVHAGSLDDLFLGNAGDFGSLCRGHTLLRVVDARLELVETIAPVLDVLVIVEILVDDDREQAHGKRGIRAGTQAQVDVGAAGEPVHARIDHDEARAAAHHVDDGMAEEAVAVGRQRHLAPHDETLGQLVGWVIETSRQGAGVVDLGIGRTDDVARCGQARNVAGVARLRVAVIGRAEHDRTVGVKGASFAAGAREAHAALATVLLGDAVVVLLDDGHGLIPGAALPRIGIAALLGIALHRVDDAGGIVHVVHEREAAHAETSLRNRVILIALDLDDTILAIGVDLQSAARGMTSRSRPRGQTRDGESVLLKAPRLSDVVDVGERVQFHDWGSFHLFHE